MSCLWEISDIKKKGIINNVDNFIKGLNNFVRNNERGKNGFFDENLPMYASKAPGRLDVMGGISDYSGAMVLQMPLNVSCISAVQIQPREKYLKIASNRHQNEDINKKYVSIWMIEMTKIRNIKTYDEARELIKDNKWCGYIAGCLIALYLEKLINDLDFGMSIFVDSDVPEGKGISSSAALEVSVMLAMLEALDIIVDGERMAILCQMVENKVVLAPCGIMDQMTSSMGQKDKLLALLCRPGIIEGYLSIPSDIVFCAIDSGERHSIGASDYISVRTAAFMGLKIIQCKYDKNIKYLTNIDEIKYNDIMQKSLLPDEILGEEFLNIYGIHIDNATTVIKDKIYYVKQATIHPINEHLRTLNFEKILQSNNIDYNELGRLMYLSHQSYVSIGLNSKGTDLLVDLSKSYLNHGIFGAKITGGGSGGAICLLIKKENLNIIENIQKKYQNIFNIYPNVFIGSSDGAYFLKSFTLHFNK